MILVFPVSFFFYSCVCVFILQKTVLVLHKAHKGMRSYSG